jgi:hypothetical protein
MHATAQHPASARPSRPYYTVPRRMRRRVPAMPRPPKGPLARSPPHPALLRRAWTPLSLRPARHPNLAATQGRRVAARPESVIRPVTPAARQAAQRAKLMKRSVPSAYIMLQVSMAQLRSNRRSLAAWRLMRVVRAGRLCSCGWGPPECGRAVALKLGLEGAGYRWGARQWQP